MNVNHVEVWDSCLQLIRQELQPSTFSRWFKPIRPVRMTEDVLTIQVPNPFFCEFLEENHLGLLRKCINKFLGDKGRLEYQYNQEGPAAASKVENRKRREVDISKIKNAFVIPGIKKQQVDPQLNDRYRFDNFVEGDCNRLARSAGLAIADRPGKTAFNPLFLYGEVGLGKTHLAQAIGNEVLKKHPSKQVLYITTEQMMNETITAIRNSAVEDMLNFYLSLEVLIIDDIQFMHGKNKLQEIFFNIFNRLHQKNHQIILTSDKAPKELEGINERIISRFKWGLSADLQRPGLETRMAIFYAKMEEHAVDMTPEVVEYICHNIDRNVRELEGVLISLLAQSSLNGNAITLELAKSVVRSFISEIHTEINPEVILNMVSKHFGVPVEKLLGTSRKREIVIARQISMYLCVEFTKLSLKAIGKQIGGKHHSTVIYSSDSIRDLMDADMVIRDHVMQLRKKLEMALHV